MPLIPVHVEPSTIAITSVASAAIAYGVCRTMALKRGISLAIAVGVGIALFNSGVIPIGVLAVVAIGISISLFKGLFKDSTAASPKGVAASASLGKRPVGSILANLMKDVTLNSPDSSQMQSIVSVCPHITEADQARLRVCITVAQSALFLWYFEQLQNSIASEFRRQFLVAISDALSATPLEAALEDYVPLEEERVAFLSATKRDTPLKRAANGHHQVRIVDLILGLLNIRKAAYFQAIASDISLSPIPFLSSGQLTVRGFAGQHYNEYPLRNPLANMIGAYLAFMLALAHKTSPSSNA